MVYISVLIYINFQNSLCYSISNVGFHFLKDEKIKNVLGHFQKDFEGGVSAENLGKWLITVLTNFKFYCKLNVFH